MRFPLLATPLLLIAVATAAHATTSERPAPGKPADLRDDGLPHLGTRYIPVPKATELEFDKSWNQLSYSQQRIIRNWYENLDINDEPPYPVEGLAPMYADIVKVQARVAVNGHLFASVTVDATGKATKVSFLEIPDQELKEVLAFIMLKPAYKPGKCNGKPCEMEFPVQADFGSERVAPAAAPTGEKDALPKPR